MKLSINEEKVWKTLQSILTEDFQNITQREIAKKTKVQETVVSSAIKKLELASKIEVIGEQRKKEFRLLIEKGTKRDLLDKLLSKYNEGIYVWREFVDKDNSWVKINYNNIKNKYPDCNLIIAKEFVRELMGKELIDVGNTPKGAGLYFRVNEELYEELKANPLVLIMPTTKVGNPVEPDTTMTKEAANPKSSENWKDKYMKLHKEYLILLGKIEAYEKIFRLCVIKKEG